jgi:hypothetical protein
MHFGTKSEQQQDEQGDGDIDFPKLDKLDKRMDKIKQKDADATAAAETDAAAAVAATAVQENKDKKKKK